MDNVIQILIDDSIFIGYSDNDNLLAPDELNIRRLMR